MPIASEWKQQWPGLQWSARTCAPFEWGLAAWRGLLGHPVAWRCKWWHLTCLGDAAITFPLTSLWGQQIQVACLEATEQSKAWLWLLSRGVLLIFSKVFCNNFLGVFFFCISWFPITISSALAAIASLPRRQLCAAFIDRLENQEASLQRWGVSNLTAGDSYHKCTIFGPLAPQGSLVVAWFASIWFNKNF